MDDTIIAQVRAFNRFYTRLVGALDEHIVQSPYTLAEARVLYEIATRGHTSSADVGRALGLDRAYLSRILQKLIGEDLVVVTPNVADRRSNQLALSRQGDEAFRQLDTGSNDAVAALLEPLAPVERATLLGAMRTIRRFLGDGADPAATPVVLRPHRIGELGWLIHRQGLLYNQQFGWNIEFEALIAGIYRDYELAPEDPPKALWVAERDGTIAGSVFMLPSEGRPGTAQLRMLYVEPEARGLGIGRTLVDQCVRFARDNGYRRMRLWTQSMLVPARRIYAAAGFELVDSAPHHSFGVDLVGENWERAL